MQDDIKNIFIQLIKTLSGVKFIFINQRADSSEPPVQLDQAIYPPGDA
jgi:hypothetical protein